MIAVTRQPNSLAPQKSQSRPIRSRFPAHVWSRFQIEKFGNAPPFRDLRFFETHAIAFEQSGGIGHGRVQPTFVERIAQIVMRRDVAAAADTCVRPQFVFYRMHGAAVGLRPPADVSPSLLILRAPNAMTEGKVRGSDHSPSIYRFRKSDSAAEQNARQRACSRKFDDRGGAGAQRTDGAFRASLQNAAPVRRRKFSARIVPSRHRPQSGGAISTWLSLQGEKASSAIVPPQSGSVSRGRVNANALKPQTQRLEMDRGDDFDRHQRMTQQGRSKRAVGQERRS